MEYIRETPDISNEEKKRFFKSANTNLGTSALCLSGGASFGYCMQSCSSKMETTNQGSVHPLPDHFGVVKAFIDQNLLPRVISGTSAGGLVAALICTYTDEELKELLVPELANRITACEDPFKVWFRRFWLTGARFDSATWARKVSAIGGSPCDLKDFWHDSHLFPSSVGMLLYTRLNDIPGSLPADWAYPECLGNPSGAPFVSGSKYFKLKVDLRVR